MPKKRLKLPKRLYRGHKSLSFFDNSLEGVSNKGLSKTALLISGLLVDWTPPCTQEDTPLGTGVDMNDELVTIQKSENVYH